MARVGKHAGAGNLAAATAEGILCFVPYAGWNVNHQPAVNTKATASKAAGATGVQHVCTGFLASFCAGTSAPAAIQVFLNIRDGATGVGTIIWQCSMSLPATAGTNIFVAQSDLCLLGTAATAMTIEFSAAGGANTFETVSMQGYDVS